MRKNRLARSPLPAQSTPVDRSCVMKSTESISASGVRPSFSAGGTVCIPFTDTCISVEVEV